MNAMKKALILKNYLKLKMCPVEEFATDKISVVRLVRLTRLVIFIVEFSNCLKDDWS
jgi:hypothetical protein